MDTQKHIQSVSKQISVSAQLSPEQLELLKLQNFRSVLNLRSYQEEGADQQDQQRAESQGLSYANLALKPAELDVATIDELLRNVRALPKPLLIYCGSAMRATFIALLYVATESGMTLEEIQQKGRSLGFNFEDKVAFDRAMKAYIRDIAK